ncbi:MAG: hypothetical protein ACAI25_10260, partial [Planctomycetota bacterium]
MRLSRRWLAFTPVVPAAGLLLLLRAGAGTDLPVKGDRRDPLVSPAGRDRLGSSAQRRPGGESPSGRVEAPSSRARSTAHE